MVSKILLFQGMSNNSCIDKKVIVPHMVKVTVGIDEDIDIFRPGLFGNFSRAAVDHDTYVIIDEYSVRFTVSFFSEKNIYSVIYLLNHGNCVDWTEYHPA